MESSSTVNTPSHEAEGHPSVLPAQLLAFAEQNVGQVHEAVDCSWPRENSRVWKITAGRLARTWYLKQHPTVTFHAREMHAYARWTTALGPGRAPELHAASPALTAVILTTLPGINPHHHELSTEDEREIHRQLGQLLHSLHHCEPQRPPTFHNPPLDQLLRRFDTAGPHLTPGDANLIQYMASRLAALTPLPGVPTHGDVQLRNTLWNPETGVLGLIDYERAEYGPACRDLIRLEYGPWNGRPDLKAAFFSGFGRALTSLEADHLRAMTTLDALSGIAFGTGAGDEEVITRGQRTLQRLHQETGL